MFKRNTIEYRGFTVTSVLHQQSIYLKLFHETSFDHYEGNITLTDFNLEMDLLSIYNLMIKCFVDNDDEYDVNPTFFPDAIQLKFETLVNRFLEVNFELVLEKVMEE